MNWDCLAGAGDKIPQLSCAFVVFQNVINAALGLAGVIALVFIIYGGIKFITSGGDQKKVAAARGTLTYAIIGLLLVFFSFAIVYFLSTITGVDCIRKFGFNNCS